jgi:chromosomal replication initiation ATPase DnaA
MNAVFSLWRPRPRTMHDIAHEVCDRHGLTWDELTGARRRRREAWPRQEAMALMYDTGRFSLGQIGRVMGGRHHTTVLLGIRAHRARNSVPLHILLTLSSLPQPPLSGV